MSFEGLEGGGFAPALPLGIVLPEDKVRISQLVIKKAEYEKRLESLRYRAPDAGNPPTAREVAGLNYRILILDTLFVEGSIDTKTTLEELSQEPGFDEWEADEAIRIVNDYCENGGQNNQEGTGLTNLVPDFTA